ncbi:MAG: S1-like domain-containing RNA-binding protein [Prevotellaceae bacterium]|nr:S1-like domain-containing RNA-binding protein [Prevotellaceae bacterium]MDY3856860.1 S1-like domain-containing RNA-binding protein [Bacteroidaceae bacterium]
MEIGHYNTLRITGFTSHGALLDGDGETILMPRKYVTPELQTGDEVRVFVYLDQDDRLVATLEQPRGEVGQFCFLRVAWVNKYGAFLDWGLTKDLFVPYREQWRRMVKDASYLVYIYIDDKTGRIVASSKLDKFVQTQTDGYRVGQAVKVVVWKQTPMGFKVIVDGKYAGLVYRNEIFQPLHIGDKLDAYVKSVRPDGKLDIVLQTDGKRHVDDFAQQLFEALRQAGGFLPVGDATPADEIYSRFEVSKKTFKRAVGSLYKQGVITISDEGIRLV